MNYPERREHSDHLDVCQQISVNVGSHHSQYSIHPPIHLLTHLSALKPRSRTPVSCYRANRRGDKLAGAVNGRRGAGMGVVVIFHGATSALLMAAAGAGWCYVAGVGTVSTAAYVGC